MRYELLGAGLEDSETCFLVVACPVTPCTYQRLFTREALDPRLALRRKGSCNLSSFQGDTSFSPLKTAGGEEFFPGPDPYPEDTSFPTNCMAASDHLPDTDLKKDQHRETNRVNQEERLNHCKNYQWTGDIYANSNYCHHNRKS